MQIFLRRNISKTDFTDFLAFNVYLHREEDFRRYLFHLLNLAGDRPLVLTEIGMDSIREGLKSQARFRSQQLLASFEMGVAGAVIFSGPTIGTLSPVRKDFKLTTGPSAWWNETGRRNPLSGQ